MHPYKIEVFNYTQEGAVGEPETTRYADNPEQARLICREYEGRKQENGLKKFKVELHILCYKLCPDKQTFFDQFRA